LIDTDAGQAQADLKSDDGRLMWIYPRTVIPRRLLECGLYFLCLYLCLTALDCTV